QRRSAWLAPMSLSQPRRLLRRIRAGQTLIGKRLRGQTFSLDHLALWPVALMIGIVTGYAVLGFRTLISVLQEFFYGADEASIHSFAAGLPWWQVLIIPILGGLVVGQILVRLSPTRRARGIDDVIEAAALKNGRVGKRQGAASALAAVVTLSCGGSTGREGPAVHIGAVIASWVSDRLKATPITARDILGCAAAAAVSASFNAPIAGAIFALEVILRHYALHSFGPIVMSSVAAAVVSRIHLGDFSEFDLPAHTLAFYWEMPAFIILGIVCGLVSVTMMRGLFFAERIGDRVQATVHLPDSLRPAFAGALLGLVAIWFPHIIGVGYETTLEALRSNLTFSAAVLFAMVKVIAVAITFSGRMGGGVFSPSIMVGALTGAAFGNIATAVFPMLSGVEAIYALAGMGAVAGAVLGAPISSTLIVFELTGDFQAAIAVMIAVSLASVISGRMVERSFFLTVLERRGLHLSDGPQGYLAATMKVGHLMRPRGAENCAPDGGCFELVDQGAFLTPEDTLERALPMFERLHGAYIPVVVQTAGDSENAQDLLGAIYHVDALRAYNRTLEEELREEHL
ncbi:MAG: chloride channel protein, partial [Pseudomonadota bacterium]